MFKRGAIHRRFPHSSVITQQSLVAYLAALITLCYSDFLLYLSWVNDAVVYACVRRSDRLLDSLVCMRHWYRDSQRLEQIEVKRAGISRACVLIIASMSPAIGVERESFDNATLSGKSTVSLAILERFSVLFHFQCWLWQVSARQIIQHQTTATKLRELTTTTPLSDASVTWAYIAFKHKRISRTNVTEYVSRLQ